MKKVRIIYFSLDLLYQHFGASHLIYINFEIFYQHFAASPLIPSCYFYKYFNAFKENFRQICSSNLKLLYHFFNMIIFMLSVRSDNQLSKKTSDKQQCSQNHHRQSDKKPRIFSY